MEVEEGERVHARRWLASYPASVAAEIGPERPRDLATLITRSCARNADRAAFTCLGVTIDYATFETLCDAFAAWLAGLELPAGTRVAVMMPNILAWPVAAAGTLKAGMILVPVNPLYTARELKHQLADSGATVLVVMENFAHTFEAVAKETPVEHVCVASAGDCMGARGRLVDFVARHVKRMVPAWRVPGHVPFRAALEAGRKACREGRGARAVPKPEDVALLQYTGGTTGVAKGAVLTHANIASNVAQNLSWLQSAFTSRREPRQLTYLCALPLYHVFALTVTLFTGIEHGTHIVLAPNARDIGSLIAILKRYPISVLPGLSTLFAAMLRHKGFDRINFSRLILTLGGGMATEPDVAKRWQAVTGCAIAEGYGLSEASPVVSANRFDLTAFTGTIGVPLPSTDIVVLDDAGCEMAAGERGEICVKGPQVMREYWKQPDETRAAFTENGYLRTGDIGMMAHDGTLTLIDRRKDMIVVSGFNVYPSEIEAVVCEHPGVRDAAAIAMPDAMSGEVVKLFVVAGDENLDEATIRAWCRERLTNYKRPRSIVFANDLPRSALGKVLRRKLRTGEPA
ncbi:AMP-binding protein [Pararhizobium mangrovi]|uniref:Long-chain-fatty-acid--CoA ligase n=1 Tax=Pararhizobium mangrovi TaxID=2590452 RepID=A0A506TZI9_9HYPH|nr:AMP-binding protein [Pararhizobium mangrovi]TPW26920.1 AMP-binding protein [Pararhizobium mangrovi]